MSVTSKTRWIDSNKTPKRESNLCSGCLQSAEHQQHSLVPLFCERAWCRSVSSADAISPAHTHSHTQKMIATRGNISWIFIQPNERGRLSSVSLERCVFCEFVIFLITSRARNFKFHAQFNTHWNLLNTPAHTMSFPTFELLVYDVQPSYIHGTRNYIYFVFVRRAGMGKNCNLYSPILCSGRSVALASVFEPVADLSGGQPRGQRQLSLFRGVGVWVLQVPLAQQRSGTLLGWNKSKTICTLKILSY